MKKVLNTDSIQNELRGASVFFPIEKTASQQERIVVTAPPEPPATIEKSSVNTSSDNSETSHVVMPSRSHDVMPPSSHDSTLSRSHDGMAAQTAERLIIERHHKRVKRAAEALQSIGSLKGTMRLTAEERTLLKSAVYNYEANGINISENEIIRIALNYLLEEDEYPDSESQLDQIIKEGRKAK